MHDIGNRKISRNNYINYVRGLMFYFAVHKQQFSHIVKSSFFVPTIMPELLEVWLAPANVNYTRSVKVLIALNQWLALTML